SGLGGAAGRRGGDDRPDAAGPIAPARARRGVWPRQGGAGGAELLSRIDAGGAARAGAAAGGGRGGAAGGGRRGFGAGGAGRRGTSQAPEDSGACDGRSSDRDAGPSRQARERFSPRGVLCGDRATSSRYEYGLGSGSRGDSTASELRPESAY